MRETSVYNEGAGGAAELLGESATCICDKVAVDRDIAVEFVGYDDVEE